MQISNFKDLYIQQLRDLYNAEQQLTKALPKMAEAAQNSDLRQAFQSHLKETENQLKRLEKIFTDLNEKPGSHKCEAMQGLVKEGEEIIKNAREGGVRDAGLIAAAQRVEHYEMAGYGSVREFARMLGQTEHARLLQETLDEEGQADKKLNSLAEKINSVAVR
ncbi:MAG: ferritin-like domain-containing protein [Vulcanimicrobiota bacterium]